MGVHLHSIDFLSVQMKLFCELTHVNIFGITGCFVICMHDVLWLTVLTLYSNI